MKDRTSPEHRVTPRGRQRQLGWGRLFPPPTLFSFSFLFSFFFPFFFSPPSWKGGGCKREGRARERGAERTRRASERAAGSAEVWSCTVFPAPLAGRFPPAPGGGHRRRHAAASGGGGPLRRGQPGRGPSPTHPPGPAHTHPPPLRGACACGRDFGCAGSSAW